MAASYLADGGADLIQGVCPHTSGAIISLGETSLLEISLGKHELVLVR